MPTTNLLERFSFHVKFSQISSYKLLDLQVTYLIFLADFKQTQKFHDNESSGNKYRNTGLRILNFLSHLYQKS